MTEPERRVKIFEKISDERWQQERLKQKGRFRYTCADVGITHMECLVVLGEEYGESCRAVLNLLRLSNDAGLGADRLAHLEKELIQVAAVSVAWLEKIDKLKSPYNAFDDLNPLERNHDAPQKTE